MDLARKNYSSGAPMEEIDGYSRIVQTGPFVFVGGTTSVQPDGSMVAEGDSYGQVRYVLLKLLKLLEQTGASKEDVYSVKIYQTPDFDSKEGYRAYSEIFHDVMPLLTGVTIHKLTRPTQLVEIEMNAIAGCSKSAKWEGITLQRTNFASGSPLEAKLGYSRMVKIGPFVYIGGTTSVQPDGKVAGANDSNAQDDFILEKEISLLEKAGAKASDIVKIKRYVKKEFLEQFDPDKTKVKFSKEQMAYSEAVIDKLTREAQLLETELFAIVGCGGSECLEEWGNIDFRKESVGKTKDGFAQAVKAGPFVYGSLVHCLDKDGNVVGIGDSEIQESYAVEYFTKLFEYFEVAPKEVVKLKGYYTKDFGTLYGETETPYYEKVYKPVKPLYTGVYVSEVGKKDEIFTLEMMAVKGCAE
jgi:enamine deaminase RidA (YjgF/YER057c/UK114 family)